MTFTSDQIVVMVVPSLAALAAYLQGRKNQNKIEQIHVTINSRISELLTATESAARAAGHAEGKAEAAKVASGLVTKAAEVAVGLVTKAAEVAAADLKDK